MSAVPQQVQAASGINTTFLSSVSATFGSPNSVGNMILVAWEGDEVTANGGNTPTDTAGNTYVRLASVNIALDHELEVWVCYNCKQKAGNVVTVTDTGGGVNSIVIVEEWIGVSTLALIDQTAGASGNGTALSSGATATTTNERDLLWVAGNVDVPTGSNVLSLGTNFSNLTQNTTPGFSCLGIESRVVNGRAAYTGLFTSSISQSWSCIIVAMRAASAAPSFKNNLRPRIFSPGNAR
jgi:hypothetical protein